MMQSLTNPDFGYFAESTADLKAYAVHHPSASTLSQQAALLAAHQYGHPTKMSVHDQGAYVDAITEGAPPSQDFFSSFLNSDFPIDVSFPVQTVPEAVPMMKGYATSRVQSQAPIMQVAHSQSGSGSTPAPTKSKAKAKVSGSKRKAAQIEASSSGDEAPVKQSTDVEAKRQKRRVKNREAAQLFRQRQKQHIRDLEQQVADINNKNIEVSTQMEVLKAENALVKDQLKYLRCFVLEGIRSAFPEQKFKEMENYLAGVVPRD